MQNHLLHLIVVLDEGIEFLCVEGDARLFFNAKIDRRQRHRRRKKEILINLMAKNHVMLLLFLFAAAGEVAGTNHIVGKSFGWSIPRNASFYQDWAAPRTFYVGDKLVFLYASGMHNVIEVSKEDYDACTQKDTITIHFSGPTILRITKPGDHYFICGLRRHCFGGQKLNIKAEQDPAEMGSVAAAASSFPTSFSLLFSVLSIFLLFMFM